MTYRHWLPLAFLFVFVACDMEKLTSFRLEDLSGKDSTSISGYIHRKDTEEPVPGARVVVNFRKAVSKSNGYYFLPVFYDKDINRNLTVPLIVTAKNFETYIRYMRVLPEAMVISLNLIWAVPIIKRPSVRAETDGEVRVTAEITDFQGIETVVLVKAYFAKGLEKFETILTLNYKQNFASGFFRSEPLLFIHDPDLGWQIEATDVDGHTDFLYILRDGRIIRRDPE